MRIVGNRLQKVVRMLREKRTRDDFVLIIIVLVLTVEMCGGGRGVCLS